MINMIWYDKSSKKKDPPVLETLLPCSVMLYNLFPSDSFMVFISGDLNPSSAVLIAGLMMQVWLLIACKDRKTCLSGRSIFLPFLGHMTRQACCLMSRKHLMNFRFLASFDLKKKKKKKTNKETLGWEANRFLWYPVWDWLRLKPVFHPDDRWRKSGTSLSLCTCFYSPKCQIRDTDPNPS